MKRTSLLLLTLIASIVAMANPVTPDEARQRVAKSINPRRAATVVQNPSALQLVSTSHYQEREGVLAPSYYVFNMGQKGGYVIAAADDRVPAVLGYSDCGTFDPDNMPENMKAWLQGYDCQMEYLAHHPETAARINAVIGDEISPLLGNIEWGQSTPFNDLCPSDPVTRTRSITGCVATAMAQIMCYWQYPDKTTEEIPGYTTRTRKTSVLGIAKGATIDWANILPKYRGRETDAQKKAVAQLMLLCGTAVEMDYTSDFSGSSGGPVAFALREYLDYDLATEYLDRNDYRRVEWEQKVYNELAEGRPVYYDGSSSGSGHAFVIDGYGGNDYFHVNWGWNGGSNDYFLLSILEPGSNAGLGASNTADGYNFGQGAIFGVQPNTGRTPSFKPELTTNAYAICDTTAFGRKSTAENFQFKIGFTYFNNSRVSSPFYTGVGVFDGNNNYLGYAFGFRTAELPPGYGFYNPAQYPTSIRLGAGMTEGTFILKPIYSLDGKTWDLCKYADQIFITATIYSNGDSIRLSPPVFAIEGELEATGKTEVGSPMPVKAKVTNKGDFFKGEIFFMVDGKMIGGRHYDLDSGASDEINFTIMPDLAGKHEISVCTRSFNYETIAVDYSPFVSDSIEVAPASTYHLAINGIVENAHKHSNGDVVTESGVHFKATIKNNGTNTYSNKVRAVIFMDGHDGYFYSVTESSKVIELPAGQTTEVAFDFKNLDDERYRIIIYTTSKGQSTQSYRGSIFTIDTGYYLVGELNNWSSTDKSYPFTKLSDDKTYEITIPAIDRDIFMKVAPASAYNYTDGEFWSNLLGAPEDRWTPLTGNMKWNGGAWLLPTSLNAETYTIQIVPSEMTYMITYVEKEKPFEPEAPYYYVGDNTSWMFDATQVFTDNQDGTYSYTFKPVYHEDGTTWFKVAPANAIASDNSIMWPCLFHPESDGTALSGNMVISDGDPSWKRTNADNAESYTITINPTLKTYSLQIKEVDGIQLVNAEKTFTPAYNINGQKVSDGYKGLIIRNGRKVIVK